MSRALAPRSLPGPGDRQGPRGHEAVSRRWVVGAQLRAGETDDPQNSLCKHVTGRRTDGAEGRTGRRRPEEAEPSEGACPARDLPAEAPLTASTLLLPTPIKLPPGSGRASRSWVRGCSCRRVGRSERSRGLCCPPRAAGTPRGAAIAVVGRCPGPARLGGPGARSPARMAPRLSTRSPRSPAPLPCALSGWAGRPLRSLRGLGSEGRPAGGRGGRAVAP